MSRSYKVTDFLWGFVFSFTLILFGVLFWLVIPKSGLNVNINSGTQYIRGVSNLNHFILEFSRKVISLLLNRRNVFVLSRVLINTGPLFQSGLLRKLVY